MYLFTGRTIAINSIQNVESKCACTLVTGTHKCFFSVYCVNCLWQLSLGVVYPSFYPYSWELARSAPPSPPTLVEILNDRVNTQITRHCGQLNSYSCGGLHLACTAVEWIFNKFTYQKSSLRLIFALIFVYIQLNGLYQNFPGILIAKSS